jgi:hypothetical protein
MLAHLTVWMYTGTMAFLVSGFHSYDMHQTYKDGFKSLVFFDDRGIVLANIRCRFPAHSVYRNPSKPSEFLIFDKAHLESARIIWTAGAETQIDYFTATPEHLFYGHGFYLPDGKSFICTERKKNAAGKLTLRDSGDFRVLREYPLPGIGPHDSVLMGDGKTVAVACDGAGVVPLAPPFSLEISHVAYVDLASGNVIATSDCDRDDLALGHLAVSSQQEVYSLMNRYNDNSGGSSGLFSLGKMGMGMRTCYASKEINERLVEQNLSLALDEKNRRVVVVSPQSNLVTTWSMDDGTFLGHLPTERPSGVTLDPPTGDYLVTAFPNRLLRLSPALDIIEEVTLQIYGQFETHILRCE